MTNLQLITEKVDAPFLPTDNLPLEVTPGFFKRLLVALGAVASVESISLKGARLTFEIDSRSAVIIHRGFYVDVEACVDIRLDVIKGMYKTVKDAITFDAYANEDGAVFLLETLTLEDAAYKWVGGRRGQEGGALGRQGQGQGSAGKSFGSVGTDGVTVNRIGVTSEGKASSGSGSSSDKDSGSGSESDKDSGSSSTHLKP